MSSAVFFVAVAFFMGYAAVLSNLGQGRDIVK